MEAEVELEVVEKGPNFEEDRNRQPLRKKRMSARGEEGPQKRAWLEMYIWELMNVWLVFSPGLGEIMYLVPVD